MRITQSHLDYWMQRRGPAFAKLLERPHKVDINSLIPSEHTTKPHRTTLHNTLVILRGHRQRHGAAGVRAQLKSMIVDPGCLDSSRRTGYCVKWLKGIDRKPKHT